MTVWYRSSQFGGGDPSKGSSTNKIITRQLKRRKWERKCWLFSNCCFSVWDFVVLFRKDSKNYSNETNICNLWISELLTNHQRTQTWCWWLILRFYGAKVWLICDSAFWSTWQKPWRRNLTLITPDHSYCTQIQYMLLREKNKGYKTFCHPAGSLWNPGKDPWESLDPSLETQLGPINSLTLVTPRS